MYPILFSLGPVKIYSFGVFIVLAAIVCAFLIWREGVRRHLDEEKTVDFLIVLALSGLLGGRVYYLLTHLQDFLAISPLYWFFIFHFPGLSFWGSVLGGSVGIWFFAKKEKLNFWRLGDIAVIGLALGEAIGRLGAFFSGSSYGIATNLPWGVKMIGLVGKRHPTQIYEGLTALLIFFILLKIKDVVKQKKLRTGILAVSYLFLLSSSKFFLEFLRADSVYWKGYSIEQIISLLFGGISVILISYMFKFPINLLKPIEDYLKKQKAETEKRMADLSAEDPFEDKDRLMDNAAIDTEVKEQEGHERIEAIKLELSRNLVRIRKALTKIKIGKYGLCEKCGKMIDTDRLAIMPMAEFCLECEKKKEK